MKRFLFWLNFIFINRKVFIAGGPIFFFFYIKYSKILNDKRYKFLKNNYKKYGLRILISFTINNINEIFDDKITDKKKYDNLNFLLQNIKFKKSLFYELKFIYNYFRFYGSLRIANLINKKINIIVQENYNFFYKTNLDILVKILIQENNDKLINKIINKIINNEKYHSLLLYYSLVNNKKILKMQIPNLHFKDKKNLNFKNFIYNQNIIIFGPNFYLYNERNKDEFYNIVDPIKIYTTYRDYTNIKNNTKGKKEKKICYLNSYKINNLYNEIQENLNIFDWITVKNLKDFNIMKTIKKNNLRISNDIDFFFVNGSPMMLQTLLYDMLIFQPSTIFVTGIDFYILGISSNYKYKDYDNKLQNISESIREHEIFENRLIIKQLKDNDFIKTDKDLENILKINDDDFAKLLDHHYRKFTF